MGSATALQIADEEADPIKHNIGKTIACIFIGFALTGKAALYSLR